MRADDHALRNVKRTPRSRDRRRYMEFEGLGYPLPRLIAASPNFHADIEAPVIGGHWRSHGRMRGEAEPIIVEAVVL